MGFRNGAYAMVWSVEPKKDTWTKCRISTSKKNKETGEYEQDFSKFVDFLGTACAKKASTLTAPCKIRLGDTEVTAQYDGEKKIEYLNFRVWSFETADNTSTKNTATESMNEPQPQVDSGDYAEARLPF